MPAFSGFSGPGGYLTGSNRLTQMLANMPDSNNGTMTGGMGSILQKALLGYMMGQDQKNAAGAQDTMNQAMTAMMGTPASTIAWNQPTRPDGSGDPITMVQAVPGNTRLAAQLLASNPQTAQMGYGLAMNDLQQQQADARLAKQFQNQKDLLLAPRFEAEPTAVREYKFAQEQGYKGSFEDFKKTTTNMGQEQFGMSPIWGTDENGNPVLLQASNRGGIKPASLPPGVTPQRGQTTKVDLGKEWGVLDATGTLIGRIPKDVRGEAIDKAAGREIGEREGQLPQLKSKASNTMAELNTKTDLVSQDIDRAVSAASAWTTGLLGSASSSVPGTPAHDLSNLLRTIKANVGFDQLQTMRQNSPTGGALGAVSDNENALLQSVLGAIEQSQSQEQLTTNLTRLKNILAERKTRLQAAFDQDFGTQSGAQAPGQAQPNPQPAQEYDWVPGKGLVPRGQ